MQNQLFKWVLCLTIGWAAPAFAVNIDTGPSGITLLGDIDVCKGEQAVYSVNNPDPSYTYDFTVSNGSVVTTGSTSVTILWTSTPSGTVTVDAYEQGAFVDDGTLNVTISESPEPFITSDVAVGCASQIDSVREGKPGEQEPEKCFLVCQDSEVTFTANGSSGSTFNWTATGGTIISSSGNTAIVQFNTVGSGQISVEEITTSGCIATKINCVEVIPKPKADFTIIPTEVFDEGRTCIFRELNFIDLSTTNNGSALISWQWDFGDGNYSNDPNPSHTYTEPGDYTITLTVENECHCTDTYTFEISVGEAEPLEVDCPSVVCEGEEVIYTIKNDECGKYKWEVTGGEITSGDPASVSFIGITWGDDDNSPFGYLTIQSGCDDSCPTSIKVPIIQSVGEIEGPTEVCAEEEYLYRLPRWPSVEFNWVVTGDLQLAYTDQPNEVVIIPNPNGNGGTLKCAYESKLVGCGGKASIDINAVDPATMEGPELACVGGSPQFELNNSYSGNWVAEDGFGNQVTGSGNIFNPSFTVAGNYIVTVSGSGFCPPDPLEVEVLEQPVMADQISGSDEVCSGIPYDYSTGNSIPGTTLNWAVDGGSFSNNTQYISGEKATITFSGSGPYTIKVWREYQANVGCSSDTLYKTIGEKQIVINLEGAQTVCSNTYHEYTSLYSEGDNYEWKIIPETMGSVTAGNGGPGIQVLWNDVSTAQTAQIELRMRECGQLYTQTMNVTVLPVPSITISAPTTVCRGAQVSISIPTSIGSFSSIDWDFGDGNTASTSSQTVNHTYTSLANGNVDFTITATVNNPNGCNQSASAQHTITVQPSPVANVTPAGQVTVCNGATVSETLTATVQSGFGGPYLYQWYNGTSQIAGATGTIYTAGAGGNYYCVVTGTNGCSANTNTVEIIETNCSGTGPGCFYGNSSDITLSYTISDCGEVTVNASYPTWGTNPTWSDGPSSSNATSATYNFTEAGEYSASLSVTRVVNGQTCTYSNTITFIVPFVADLKYQVACASGQYQVTLTDFSNYYPSTPIGDYEFFIDGNSVQLGSSTSYTTNLGAGTYDFKLVISDSDPAHPNCEITRTVDLPAYPVADFTFNSNNDCQGAPIEFINQSTPTNGLEYFWNFDDGATVKVQTPFRVYDLPGSKQVTLTVTNQFGCQSSISKTVNISDNNLSGSISPLSAIACEGSNIVLSYDKDLSTDDPSSYAWQPDSFAVLTHPNNTTTVMESGSYFATVSDISRCTFSTQNVSVEFVPMPDPVITGLSDVCLGEDIKLYGDAGTADYDYNWSIITGSGSIATPSAPNITLETGPGGLAAGNYTFELELSINSPINCSRTATFDVTVHDLPVDPQITTSLVQCNPYTVELTATHPDQGTFTWSDGQSDNTINVNKGGEYYVMFTNLAGCSSRQRIDVDKSPAEYLWIYPLGCYTFCAEEVQGMEAFDIPDPIIPFNEWGLTENGSFTGYSGTNSVPDVKLPVNQSGSYGYSLSLNGCTSTSKFVDVTIEEECCRLDVSIEGFKVDNESEDGCRNLVLLFIDNPYGVPITVSLSSDLGVFVPNTVTIPPGGASIQVEFYPLPGVTGGSIGEFNAVSEFSPGKGEPAVRCIFNDNFKLPNDICEANGWKQSEVEAANSISLAGSFSIAPNPANNKVDISYGLPNWTGQSAGQIEIHDLRGALIENHSINSGEGVVTLNTSHWKPSVYIIVFRVNGELRDYQRLIIQR